MTIWTCLPLVRQLPQRSTSGSPTSEQGTYYCSSILCAQVHLQSSPSLFRTLRMGSQGFPRKICSAHEPPHLPLRTPSIYCFCLI
ncbi:hypothetical protein LguiA_010808 [Lonicera macranthoides]